MDLWKKLFGVKEPPKSEIPEAQHGAKEQIKELLKNSSRQSRVDQERPENSAVVPPTNTLQIRECIWVLECPTRHRKFRLGEDAILVTAHEIRAIKPTQVLIPERTDLWELWMKLEKLHWQSSDLVVPLEGTSSYGGIVRILGRTDALEKTLSSVPNVKRGLAEGKNEGWVCGACGYWHLYPE